MIQIGDLVNNRYRIIQQLGEGGFGTIFEVEYRGQRQVIKVLNLAKETDSEKRQKALSLFQQEAQILMELNHSGIPRVEANGYFTWENQTEILHCLLMEKIEGETLENWRNKSSSLLTIEAAINWLKQLIKILDYLHQKGYIHRDIKPANIILKPNGDLVLIDFGGVRKITETYLVKLAEDRSVTKLLTAGYTPWEQIKGKPVPQSDFFALGRTFVYLLTGKCPDSLSENDLTGELIWRDEVPSLSHDLADLIDSLIRFYPRERPGNTQVILQNLEKISVNNNIIHDFSKKDKFRQKSKGIIWGLTGVLLSAIAFPFISPELPVFCNDQGVDFEQIDRLGIAKFFYGCAIILDSSYAKPHYGLGVVHEKQTKFDQAIEEYEKAIAISPIFAAAYNNIARIYSVEYENYEASKMIIQNALKYPQSQETRYALFYNLGFVMYKQNRYQDAEQYFKTAIQQKPNKAEAYCLLAKVLEKQGRNSQQQWDTCKKFAPRDGDSKVDAWLMLR